MHVWFDGSSEKMRMDVYGGLDSTYMLPVRWLLHQLYLCDFECSMLEPLPASLIHLVNKTLACNVGFHV